MLFRYLALILLLGACSSNIGTTNITLYSKMEKDGSRFYVAKSIDDVKENNLSSLIKQTIAQYRVAYEGAGAESLSEAAFSAKNAAAQYVVYPVVKRWDTVKEPGKAYKANVEFDAIIYETATGREVNRADFVRECIFQGSGFTAGDCVNLDLWINQLIR